MEIIKASRLDNNENAVPFKFMNGFCGANSVSEQMCGQATYTNLFFSNLVTRKKCWC